jgi:hypothetical protein
VSVSNATPLNPAAAQAKIRQAMTRLGISFLEALDIVAYDPDASTACWSYNHVTGQERICVGPEIAALDLDCIEMVLRHEFLHRSTYHGFRERFENAQLLNITEDICINRLLFESYPDAMHKLSMQVYSEEAKKTIIALPDCSADPTVLEADLAALWHQTWDQDRFGNSNLLNPTSLYYRLLEVLPRHETELSITISIFAEHGGHPEQLPDPLRNAIEQNIRQIGGRLPGLGSSGEMMNSYLGTAVHFSSKPLQDFLQSLEVESMVSDSRQDLVETIRYTLNDVIPLFPSRKGLTFITTGISDLLGLYNNQFQETRPIRLRLNFYVDISGSMSNYFGVIHQFIKALFDVPLAVRLFDERIHTVSAERFLAGQFSVGGGTDFNPVINDLLQDEEAGVGVVFTDGSADLDPDTIAAFEESWKRIFVVYFMDKGSRRSASVLDRLSTRSLDLEV